MVHPIDIEPSAILIPSVEGSALDPEPSMKSTSSADGSTSDTRTVRDSCPERGWFTRLTLNHPRYQSPAWTVHPLIPEPSVIQAQNVDGSLLRYGPSVISTLSVEGPTFGIEPSAILIPSVEGSALDSEPSAIQAQNVDSSLLRH